MTWTKKMRGSEPLTLVQARTYTLVRFEVEQASPQPIVSWSETWCRGLGARHRYPSILHVIKPFS